VKSTDELAWLTGLPVLAQITLIVTPEDVVREKHRQRLLWSCIGLSLVVGLIIFHFLVMDLWIFTARLGRWVGRFL
jgi:hypothetical protein